MSETNPFPTPSIDPSLSDAGARRRDRMLGDLLGEMQRMHRARRIKRRAMLVIAPVAVIGVAALAVRWPQRASSPAPDGGSFVKSPTPIDPPAPLPAAIITMVQTNDGILEQHRAASDSGGAAQSLSDAQLLDALASLNRPAGLVRSGSRVWLTRDVADPPTHPAVGESSNSS